MKIILWIGNEPNQKALANKISNYFVVAGIVTETRKPKKKFRPAKFFEKIIEFIFLPSIRRSWLGMQRYFEIRYNSYPKIDRIDVENINSNAVLNFTKERNPDLIIISGTRLIREKLFSLNPKLGILNLHTGVSPFIKGGPNCTNWCIATKQFHLIGNTVMWLDRGIDTGNIATTELVNFHGDETLLEIQIKVMEHAHDLYLKTMYKLQKGHYSNVTQASIGRGITYYSKHWGLKEKCKLIIHLKKFRKAIKSGQLEKLKQEVKTIKV